jgi:hypothetical protein
MSSEKAREAPPLMRKIVDPPIIGAISEAGSNQEDDEKRANFFNIGFNSTNDGNNNSSEVDKISSVPFLGKQQNDFN